MKFKMMMIAIAGCALGFAPLALQAEQMQQMMDCSTMSQEMQQFASQLSPMNKALFCGKFTDVQRASAMQMASTPDASGMTMSPDMAVQKVGSPSPQKTPTGCPVK